MDSKWKITGHKFLKEVIVFEGLYDDEAKFLHFHFEAHRNCDDYTSFETKEKMPPYNEDMENELFKAINDYVSKNNCFEEDFIYALN